MPRNRLGEVGRVSQSRTQTSDFSPEKSDVADAQPRVARGDFAERVDALVVQTGGVSALARKAGLSRRMIDNYRSGSEIGLGNAVALADAGGVSLDWLAGRQSDAAVTTQNRRDDSYIAVPRYDVQAAAGSGAVVDVEDPHSYLQLDESYIRVQLGLSPGHVVMIEATGDSMTPTIRNGDLLLVDTRTPQLRGAGVYVLAVDELLLVKRVAVRTDGSIVISSDNPKYPAEEYAKRDLDRLRFVGRVAWVGGPV